MYAIKIKKLKIKRVGGIHPGLELWQRLKKTSHHVYNYNLKKLPELRFSGNLLAPNCCPAREVMLVF